MSHLTYNTQINKTSHARLTDPDAIVVRERELLFQMGDQLSGIYKINSGCVKLYRCTEDGENQIIGFYMAGDLIGMDALADGFSHSTAMMLETSNVSLIPFGSIFNQDEKFDRFAFIHQLGVNINNDNDHTMILSQPAGRRLAWFLTKYSDKLAKRGMLTNEFRIPMTGMDIALYLGMAAETSSREFKRFCKQGLISKNNREIELHDIDALRKLAGNDEQCGGENTHWNAGFNLTVGQEHSAHSHLHS